MADYIQNRLATLNLGGANQELEALRAENAELKAQLGQPQGFKSDAQTAFEQSPEFEQILNAFYLRFMREKFGAEFRASPHNQEFHTVANRAFDVYEKSIKEAPANAQAGKKNTKPSTPDA